REFARSDVNRRVDTVDFGGNFMHVCPRSCISDHRHCSFMDRSGGQRPTLPTLLSFVFWTLLGRQSGRGVVPGFEYAAILVLRGVGVAVELRRLLVGRIQFVGRSPVLVFY